MPKTCVEVCFSKLAIKYVWRADVSRGGDARDKLALERCRSASYSQARCVVVAASKGRAIFRRGGGWTFSAGS